MMQILLGSWLCECTCQDSGGRDRLYIFAKTLDERLQRELKEGRFDPFAYDPKLLLLTHNILSLNGCNGPGIEDFAEQLGRAFDTLSMIPLERHGEALLLSKLGYYAAPLVPRLDLYPAKPDALWILRADETVIRSLCANISAATLFGQCPMHGSKDEHGLLVYVLPIILLQSLREYNLELGTILIRTLCYLGQIEDAAIPLAAKFLLDQQREDGKFGHFDVEVTKIAKETKSEPSEVAKRLYLPTTVSCNWAIAELCGINLFRLIPPASDTVNPAGG